MSRLMPLVSTALNVLNFILSVKRGDPQIFRAHLHYMDSPKCQCWGKSKPRLVVTQGQTFLALPPSHCWKGTG